MSRIRTCVEQVLLEDMVEEDAYLIMGDSDVDSVVPANTDNGLFGNSSSDDLFDDDFEEEE